MRVVLLLILLFSSTGVWFCRQPIKAAVFPPLPSEVASGLPLKLAGIVTEQGESLAVIQDLRGDGIDFYRPGEPLPYGGRLLRIDPSAAMIVGPDGSEWRLALEEPPEPGGNGLRVVRIPGQPVMLLEMPPVPKGVRGFLETQLIPLLRRPALTGKGVQGTPLEAVFGVLDLEDGDLVLAVNDEPLGTFKSAIRTVEQALADLPMTVTVLRIRGQVTYTYFLGGIGPAIPSPEAGAAPGALPSPVPYTGRLLVLGIVAGHAPRTMGVQVRAFESTESVLLQIRPYVDDGGSFRGLEISRADPRAEAERIGLRVGDVITAINGVTLKSLFQTLGTVKKAFKEPSAEVQVARGSETFMRKLERSF